MAKPKCHMDRLPNSAAWKGMGSLCKRDFVWITQDPAEVTCKQCLNIMEEGRRRREAAKGCGCEDWQKNIDKINGPITLQAIRSGSKGYTGKKFVYCPWCSKKLPEVL